MPVGASRRRSCRQARWHRTPSFSRSSSEDLEDVPEKIVRDAVRVRRHHRRVCSSGRSSCSTGSFGHERPPARGRVSDVPPRAAFPLTRVRDRMVTLLLAIHNHQPVATSRTSSPSPSGGATAPVPRSSRRHPRIRVAFHYSGPLLDWLGPRAGPISGSERRVADGHVELLRGRLLRAGARCPAAPRRPRAGTHDEHVLGRSARVCSARFWLCERIWDPGLPATLAGTGLGERWSTTRICDAGLQDGRFSGYYLRKGRRHAGDLSVRQAPPLPDSVRSRRAGDRGIAAQPPGNHPHLRDDG